MRIEYVYTLIAIVASAVVFGVWECGNCVLDNDRLDREVRERAWEYAPKFTLIEPKIPVGCSSSDCFRLRLICLNGFEYYIIDAFKKASLAPRLQADGRPVPCVVVVEKGETKNGKY